MTTAIPRLYAAREWAWEDTGVSLMARIYGQDAALITQASISSIALSVFDDTGDTAVATATPTVSSVVYDTLQTDARWTEDSTGYNFRYATAATQMPVGDRTYTFEFKLTPASGEAFHVVFEVQAGALKRS